MGEYEKYGWNVSDGVGNSIYGNKSITINGSSIKKYSHLDFLGYKNKLVEEGNINKILDSIDEETICLYLRKKKIERIKSLMK